LAHIFTTFLDITYDKGPYTKKATRGLKLEKYMSVSNLANEIYNFYEVGCTNIMGF
jgi:hypothetical protein